MSSHLDALKFVGPFAPLESRQTELGVGRARARAYEGGRGRQTRLSVFGNARGERK